jgi:V8-like Glu-specific endopeptidase
MVRLATVPALAAALLATPALGADAPGDLHARPAVFHSASAKAAAAVPALDFEAAQAALPDSARHALPGLSASERALLRSRDTRPKGSGLRPKRPALRVGLVRDLPAEVGFRGVAPDPAPRAYGGGWLERGPTGRWTWTASFASEGAQALRLHVRDAWLPAGSRVFLYGADGEAFGPYAFEAGTRPEGFWTHTVFAPRALLRVELGDADPAGLARARFAVASIAHLEHPALASASASVRGAAAAGTLSTQSTQSDSCFVDVSCVDPSVFPNLDAASHAVGQLNFIDNGGAFLCTGGLLNTTTSSMIPYLLTAHHCFSTQAAATSLEIFWDYKTPSCGAPEPHTFGFPNTLGSTLLATSDTSDFTLVQLSEDPPDGSVFLGWTTGDYADDDGVLIHRISHPNGRPQFYSRHQIQANPTVICEDVPFGNFIYSRDVEGGTGMGSSGSPTYLASLEVVGQELGACGTNNSDDCDRDNNLTVDGAFRVTFPSVSSWLAPASPGPCVPSAATLCLNGGRFKVTAHWTKTTGEQGEGTGVTLTADSAYFWFFDPSNVELVVKVLNACAISQKFWVFAGGLTDVAVRMTVVDTQTGAVQIYDNPPGVAFAPLQDTKAFACP